MQVKHKGGPNYYYFVIGFALSLLTGIIISIICRLKSSKLNWLPKARFASRRRWGRGTSKRGQVVASHDGEETNDIPLKLLLSAPTTAANNQM